MICYSCYKLLCAKRFVWRIEQHRTTLLLSAFSEDTTLLPGSATGLKSEKAVCGGIATASVNVDTCVWTWTLRGSGSFVIRFSLWACKFPIWILLTQESSRSASTGATPIPLVRRFSHEEGKVACCLFL